MKCEDLNEEQLNNQIQSIEWQIGQLQRKKRLSSNPLTWNREINRLRMELDKYERLRYEFRQNMAITENANKTRLD